MRFFLIFLALACAGIAAYRYGFAQPQTFRFKATIVVQTPEGAKFGSSVIETTWWRDFDPLGGTSWFAEARGVAPFIDLGSSGVLIASLKTDSGEKGVNHSDATKWPVRAWSDNGKPEFISKRTPIHGRQSPLLVWMPYGSTSAADAIDIEPKEVTQMFSGKVDSLEVRVEPTSEKLVEFQPAPPNWLIAERQKTKSAGRSRGIRAKDGFAWGLSSLETGRQ